MGGAWEQIFGGDSDMNRAQRRAADKEWRRFYRQQKKTRARSRTVPQTGKD